MRDEMPEKYRDLRYSTPADGKNGLFWVPAGGGEFYKLKVIVSDGMGWDHVSVSKASECPSWGNMCKVKDLFFEPTETVVQFHPAIEEYVNNHPYCLHLWRSQSAVHELPPSILTGIK